MASGQRLRHVFVSGGTGAGPQDQDHPGVKITENGAREWLFKDTSSVEDD